MDDIILVRRTSSLVRDIVFPFRSFGQLMIAFACGFLGYYFGLYVDNDPWGYFIVAWAGGSLMLTFTAPAKLIAPIGFLNGARKCLAEHMKYKEIQTDEWQYDAPRWARWSNSNLIFGRGKSSFSINGPLSSLLYLKAQLQ